MNNWTELVAGLAALLGLALLVDRVLQLLLAGRYVKREELNAIEKTLKSDAVLMGANVREAHHRIDLLAEVMKGLPGYGHINDLKDEVAGMKQSLAVNSTKLEGIGEDVHEIRAAVERITSELRRGGYSTK